jgi:hypothetical protein
VALIVELQGRLESDEPTKASSTQQVRALRLNAQDFALEVGCHVFDTFMGLILTVYSDILQSIYRLLRVKVTEKRAEARYGKAGRRDQEQGRFGSLGLQWHQRRCPVCSRTIRC